jgi:hypothetical protein
MDLLKKNICVCVYTERGREGERERDGAGDMGVVPNRCLCICLLVRGKKV